MPVHPGRQWRNRKNEGGKDKENVKEEVVRRVNAGDSGGKLPDQGKLIFPRCFAGDVLRW